MCWGMNVKLISASAARAPRRRRRGSPDLRPRSRPGGRRSRPSERRRAPRSVRGRREDRLWTWLAQLRQTPAHEWNRFYASAPYRRGVPHKRIRGPICHALCRSRRVVRRAINLGTRRPGARPPRRRRAKPRDVQAGGLRAHSGLTVGRRRSGPGPPAARRDAPAVPAPRLPSRRKRVGARTATARARREGRPAGAASSTRPAACQIK